MRGRSLPVAVALGVTTTIGYGTLYYAFGALAGGIASDTGMPLTWIYWLFSASLGGAALVAPFTGRLMDRIAPARVMACGSLASATALALIGFLPGKAAFGVMLLAMQIVATSVLYEAAFTVVAVHVRARARRTITIITLIAGFASTIFWPLTVWLENFIGWQEIYAIYAVLHLCICFPLHFWLSGVSMRRGKNRAADLPQPVPVAGQLGGGSHRKRAFALLLITFAAIGFTISAVHLHLIGVLGEMGLGASAALVGSLIGPAQVAGRLVEFLSGNRLPAIRILVFASAALPAGLAILTLGPPVFGVAAVAAIVFGLGQGVTFIARGVLPLELFGSQGYGSVLGKFNAATLTMMALAPALTAVVREAHGARTAMMAVGAVAAAGTLSALWLAITVRKR